MKLYSLFFALVLFGFASSEKSENTVDRQSSALGEIFAEVFDVITIDNLETPIQFRATTYINIAAWNAWCNYHPTAADIFGRTRFKRPAKDHIRENKNTAVLFALYRIYEASPQSFGGNSKIPLFRQIIRDKGFDPDDMSRDMTTAIGIGNREGIDTARLMRIDGWNAQGDLTSAKNFYAQPFMDYTEYVPKNSPWNIQFPFKWQPLLENNGLGFFFRQESVVPFAGRAIAFGQTRKEMNRRRLRSPFRQSSAPVRNASKKDIHRLRRQAKKVFDISARLTEKQRVLAEFFDNKAKGFRTAENPVGVSSIATALRFILVSPSQDFDLDEDIIYGLGAAISTFDSMVASWKEKRRLDLVRPTGQTMKFLFGDAKFKVWGGPGMTEPVRIKAGEWQPYIRTMPHSEFPSGSACTCHALVEHSLINTNYTDDIPFETTVPMGSSKFFPGQVPEKDFILKIDKLSDWSRLCSVSRMWAGVHFKPAIKAGEMLCKGIGRSSQDFVTKLVNGELDPKWLTWLPQDVERFWEEK